MKILIVDDDDLIRVMVIQALSAEGHEVLECSNGADAIAVLKEQAFDIVITDLVMPGQNGISVGEFIKNNNLPIAVLAISAHNEEGGMLDFANYFADDTLKKPFKKEDLVKSVNRLPVGGSVDSALMNM